MPNLEVPPKLQKKGQKLEKKFQNKEIQFRNLNEGSKESKI